MPSLFVIQGRDQGMRYELQEAQLTIGRVGDNQIKLHDTEVSREHALLDRRGDQFFVRDLNSSNGTYVNGKAIREQELHSGDQLQLGRTMLLFTGVREEAIDQADSRVDIVPPNPDQTDGSRIVRTLSQAEGTDLLATPADQTQSPWLARARSNLQLMYRTALAVSHTLDIDQLLSRIMDMIFEWVDADRGCILLKNEETGRLETRVRRRRGTPGSGDDQQEASSAEPADERIAISKTILDYVLERREGVLTSNAREDARWNPAQSILKMGIREAICVPMQGRYDVVGLIYIDTSIAPQQLLREQKPNKFGEEHLKLMVAIAHQAALAVEDTSYYKAMVQAERLAAVGQTIATLSHHIKNILQGVRGGSYLIDLGLQDHARALGVDLEGSPRPDRPADFEADTTAALKAVNTMRKGWGIVEKNQERISGLVMDMLTFSKEREPAPEPSNLNEVVGEVVELMQVRAQEAGVELIWNPADQMPTLLFDPEAIHRAVLNLATNAIDACEDCDPARVTLTAAVNQEQEFIDLVIEDTGVGIEKQDLENIFTVFVSKKGGRGTGLGLAVTQKVMQEHGGRVEVTSELGAGSRFRIELPMVTQSPSENPETTGDEASVNGDGQPAPAPGDGATAVQSLDDSSSHVFDA